MRIISRNTLVKFWEKFPEAKEQLLSWLDEVRFAAWISPNQLKSQYRSASILTNKRVVFNIKGNSYRLIVDVEY